jgi:BirA family transcriptional regulator, biotin operon repressor / biotin---[acetyl-CoA-carboxylase] ligase
MELPASQQRVNRLVVLDETASTNDVLTASADTEEDFSVVVTGSQTAGRGRLGRSWVAPKAKSLAISVLLRPRLADGTPLPLEHFGWLPLIAGAAMSRAIASLVSAQVRLKWPNDVQIDGLKVCGVLAELTQSGDAVVVGSGVNLSLTLDELPTPVSTSLVLAGATLEGDALADAVLSAYLVSLRGLYDEFLGSRADVEASGIRRVVTQLCSTLGKQVRVELPGGADVFGTATDIDGHGRLLVRPASGDEVLAVAAGDVTHLRYE